MSWFKSRRIQRKMQEDLNRLVAIETEKAHDREIEIRERFIVDNERDNAQYKFKNARIIAEEKARKRLVWKSNLVEKLLPQITATFLNNQSEPVTISIHQRMSIAVASILMAEAVAIEWERHSNVLAAAHKAKWAEEDSNELSSA